MQESSQREHFLERRYYTPQQSQWWDRLTLAQKFAASSLTQFGYDLAFVRSNLAGSMAVLLCDSRAATISDDGEINTNPDISIRP
jgi:hypothetical protein